ncbi:MAG: class I SAM-dependent methyltransferase [Candidatus Peribacteraceae bacterium]|nr:class I SAM-dependent methyltransferase [Candidatus Peribacteraceae bacterium]MDD5075191.1 class I SAM-dependent methyltransferase [Candidatus Peribacteraceae bacterium]
MEKSSFDNVQTQYWTSEEQRKRRHPSHPVIQAFVTPKITYMKKVCSLIEKPSIVDIGAGNGYFSYWLQEWGETTAVDYSEVILEQNPVRRKLVMDARALNFPDHSFDIAFCNAVLHHIPYDNRLTVVREMARVSGKYVIICEPNRWNPLMAALSIWKKEERGGLDFSLSYCRKLAEDAGLRVLTAVSWGALTPNRFPFAERLLPFLNLLERPLPCGAMNIIISEKRDGR